ncbi:MAG: hypothetical protein J7K49_03620 [Thaumarchaeota archaeon]|nr:hypothetical protein [Nitrososphaerota archaeon]
MLLRRLNRKTDKTFHKYFDDPERCSEAILFDTYAHQLAELTPGLPIQEVDRRTLRYLPKAIE